MKSATVPIFTRDQIIAIKNKKVDAVVNYNAHERPDSPSAIMVTNMIDTGSNQKKRFYKNSNKPLGNYDIDNNWVNKRPSTIVAMKKDLRAQGFL